MLECLERYFFEADVQDFFNIFDTANCHVEHPPETLAYLGTKVRAYFLNMKKRHPVVRSFMCATSNSGEENIAINVNVDSLEGRAVQYQI